MQRWYIAHSSIFDTRIYRLNSYKDFLKTLWYVKNVREARAYGWSNQPKVVTFNMERITGCHWNVKRLQNDLAEKFEEFRTWGAIISEKDW